MSIERDISGMAHDLRQIGMWVYEIKIGVSAANQRISQMATAAEVSTALADAKTALTEKIAGVSTKVDAVIAMVGSTGSDAAALDAIVTDLGTLKSDALTALDAIEAKADAAV